MSKEIGVVKNVTQGSVKAVSLTGESRELKVGDIVYQGEKIVTESTDAKIVIAKVDGKEISLIGKDSINLDQSVGENAQTTADITSLQKAILGGQDLNALEETAAGGNQAGGNAGGDGVSLGAASFAQGGHYSNISANFNNLSSQASANAPVQTGVGGAVTLDNLAAAIDAIYPTSNVPTPAITTIIDGKYGGKWNADVIGDLSNDNRPFIKGTAEAGSIVEIYDNGNKIDETRAYDDGTWEYVVQNDFPDGKHTITTVAVVDGERSLSSKGAEVTIDTTKPTVEWTDLPHNIIRKNVISMSDSDPEPSMTGKTEPNSEINVRIGKIEDSGTHTIFEGKVKADDNGNFTVDKTTMGDGFPEHFTPGEYSFTTQVFDPAGNSSFTNLPKNYTPKNGAFSIERIYDDDFSDLTEIQGDYSPVYRPVDGDRKPTFEGTAEANAEITLVVKHHGYDFMTDQRTPVEIQDILTTRADENGKWSVEANVDYKDSMLDYHTVEAKATNPSGETLDLTPTTFFMPTTAPVDHL
ncbi:retention module-containing protein [Campylobacter concisus]|uniref:retention module-containing protein n=1 Tax=Campylobacter concisus TaxID=199 RepID=UPI000CD91B20|nr:retention module-containing protein [Campylobacter concisus]